MPNLKIIGIKNSSDYQTNLPDSLSSNYLQTLRQLRNLPTNFKGIFACLCLEADLSKGYQHPKRKSGVTTHFSETIELTGGKFGKKVPYILCF